MDRDAFLFFIVIALFVGLSFYFIISNQPSFTDGQTAALFSFLDRSTVKNTLLTWKIIAGILSIVFAAGIVTTMALASRFRIKIHTKIVVNAPTTGIPSEKVARKEWKELLDRAQFATTSDARILIIEADSVIDRVLRRQGIPGDDMGERLKAVGGQLSGIERLWELHKLRNRIAHEPGYTVSLQELERALHDYHRVLKELGAI